MRNALSNTPPNEKLQAATGYNEGCNVEKENGAAIATGNYGVAVANGDKSIAIVTGLHGAATALKEDALALGWGMATKVKGVLGSVIAAMYTDENGTHLLVKKVDGVNIKADTWYSVVNGEFKETE